jgi:hypothetical protein
MDLESSQNNSKKQEQEIKRFQDQIYILKQKNEN